MEQRTIEINEWIDLIVLDMVCGCVIHCCIHNWYDHESLLLESVEYCDQHKHLDK